MHKRWSDTPKVDGAVTFDAFDAFEASGLSTGLSADGSGRMLRRPLYLLIVLLVSGLLAIGVEAKDCECSNVDASSKPSNDKDVCTKSQGSNWCKMDWNAGNTSSSSGNTSGGPSGDPSFNRAVADGLGKARGFNRGVAPPPVPPALSSLDEAGVWMFQLRFGSYRDHPEATAVGFIALVYAALKTRGEPDRAERFITEAKRAKEIGAALAGGSEFKDKGDGYDVRAVSGCLEVTPWSSSKIKVVISQNMLSRMKNKDCR